MAREAYLSRCLARDGLRPFRAAPRQRIARAAAAQGFNPLLASYGPALVDRAVLDALCRARGVSFYAAMQANLAGMGAAQREFAGFDFERFLPALQPPARIEARHTVGLLDAITAADLGASASATACRRRWRKWCRPTATATSSSRWAARSHADLARLQAIAAVLDRSTAALLRFAGRQRAVRRCARACRNWCAGIRARPALRAPVGLHPLHRAADRAQAGAGRWTCAPPTWASR